MKTKPYKPSIGDRVRVVECPINVFRNGMVGVIDRINDRYDVRYFRVVHTDGRMAWTDKVEPVKPAKPKKVSPLEKEVRQLPSERIREIYKELSANTYSDPHEFAIDAIINYLNEQFTEGKKK